MKKIEGNFLQEDLLNYDIDPIDVVLLNYFVQFTNSNKMKHKEIDEELYYWLSYQKLISDLPYIKISTPKSIGRRFTHLVDKGLLDRKLIGEGKGMKTYFRLTDEYFALKDNIDNQYPTKQKELKPKPESYEEPKDDIPYQKIIDYLNEKAGTNFMHKAEGNREGIRARWNEGYRLEHFYKVIIVKCEEWLDGKGQVWLRPGTLFGPKFAQYVGQKEKYKGNQNKTVTSRLTNDRDYIKQEAESATGYVSDGGKGWRD